MTPPDTTGPEARPRLGAGVAERVRTGLAMARRWALPSDDGLDDEVRNAYALAIALTLIPLALGSFHATTMVSAAAVAGLAVPALARDLRYWVLVVLLVLHTTVDRAWLGMDNHHWLHIYWLAAIAVTRLASRPAVALQHTARLLVGLAFLFAVTWKLLAPEFLTGGFFEFMFSIDRRLADVAAAFGLEHDGVTRDNWTAITAWRDPDVVPGPAELTINAAIARLAPLLAWGTVLIEAAVAVSFLAPLRQRWRRLRDVTLFTFVVTTYPLAPVIGFGELLLAMGAMQSELRTRWRNTLYVTAFIAVGLLAERDTLLAWIRAIVP